MQEEGYKVGSTNHNFGTSDFSSSSHLDQDNFQYDSGFRVTPAIGLMLN